MINNIQLLLGAIFSKLVNNHSKEFVVFLTIILSGVAFILDSSVQPIMDSMPAFFDSWVRSGTSQNLHQYLLVASYSVLIMSSVVFISATTLSLANYVKNNYDT